MIENVNFTNEATMRTNFSNTLTLAIYEMLICYRLLPILTNNISKKLKNVSL